MAATYTVVTQYPTTEFLGGTQTRAVTAVGITTKPHDVYVEFRIPNTIYTAAEVGDYSLAYSAAIEAYFTVPGVLAVSWGQQVNAGGELNDIYTVTVQSDSGNSTAQFTTIDALAPADVAKKAEPLVAALNAAEAL